MTTKQRDFIQAALDPENWRPNLSQMSEETGLAISTIKRKIESMKEKGTLEVVINEYAESEAMRRKLTEDKNGNKQHKTSN
jgi:DNA-binding MarR family transcriptional regulator